MTNDQRNISAPLLRCQRCQRQFYMVSPICADCGPGWRDQQAVPDPRVDVSRNEITGP